MGVQRWCWLPLFYAVSLEARAQKRSAVVTPPPPPSDRAALRLQLTLRRDDGRVDIFSKEASFNVTHAPEEGPLLQALSPAPDCGDDCFTVAYATSPDQPLLPAWGLRG
eukprot:Hpha_TRINITY_DN15283_c2_g3::TRINITY_DN15283_c2_g3_i1::g.68177::m.68177